MNQKEKTWKNQYYVYLINAFHWFCFLFPYPLYKWLFRLAGLKMGKGSSLDFQVYVKFPWMLEIGDRVSINRGVEFYPGWVGTQRITLGNGVRVGPNARFHTTGHDLGAEGYNEHVGGPIHVNDGAWIGAAAIILPGVTVGRGSVVAAGSVVTKDVPDWTLVGGVPAAPLRSLK